MLPVTIRLAQGWWIGGAKTIKFTPQQIQSIRYHEGVHLARYQLPLVTVCRAVKAVDHALQELIKSKGGPGGFGRLGGLGELNRST